jgi:predicted HTH transcriptional regulator
MEMYLRKLISEGENQHLDFKFCVSDSRKIARTLTAFANTDGGKILIGVRDNGSIAGVRSDEEMYMVETASHLYCTPEVAFSTRQHNSEGKTILEVDVQRGPDRPYRVKDEMGRLITYFRQNDQNLVANRVLLQVWRKEGNKAGVIVRFGKAEKILLEYLKSNGSITISRFRKLASIPAFRAESIIANLIILKIILMNASEKGCTYILNPDEQSIEAESGSF